MYMAIQNSKTCACGYRYGQYGPANSSSMCTTCSGYNCGGSNLNGITYINFFQLNLICPLFVSPGVPFTCTVQMSFNLPSGQTIADPFALGIYPTYESTYDNYEIEAPLPLFTSNSFGYNSSMLTTTFSYTYDNTSSSRTILVYAVAYSVAYAQQNIYVVASNFLFNDELKIRLFDNSLNLIDSPVNYTQFIGCYLQLVSPVTVSISPKTVDQCAWACASRNYTYSGCIKGCATCVCTNQIVNTSINYYLCNYPASGILQYGGGYTSGYSVYQIFCKTITF